VVGCWERRPARSHTSPLAFQPIVLDGSELSEAAHLSIFPE
jgi:hypothetical protein